MALLALCGYQGKLDPSRKSGGALHRLHCFCLEFDGACEVQRRVPTDWIIEPIDVSGYASLKALRSDVKREAEQELDDKWDEITADAETCPGKDGLRDRLRAHIDRLPYDKIQELFKKIGRPLLLAKMVKELIKS